jgi:DNA-binding MarR family transcriptional regulator
MSRAPQEVTHLADRLHSTSIQVLRRVRGEDIASGITPARLSALSVVVFAGPLKLGELAAAEQVRPATMSRTVDALERAGLVTKESDPEDARAVLVRATSDGTRLLQDARRRRVRALADELRGLEPEELELLDATLSALARALDLPRRTPVGSAGG